MRNKADYADTPFGFEWGHLAVTRLFSDGNAVALRVRNRISGEYVDVQCTPAGRKTFFTQGKYRPDRESEAHG